MGVTSSRKQDSILEKSRSKDVLIHRSKDVLIHPINTIYSISDAFAALMQDGSVVTWGNKGRKYENKGADSSSVQAKLKQHGGVDKIYTTSRAFVALMKNGSVVAWGDNWGNSRGLNSRVQAKLKRHRGVDKIYTTSRACAALMKDGTVVTWGAGRSADSSRVQAKLKRGVDIYMGL